MQLSPVALGLSNAGVNIGDDRRPTTTMPKRSFQRMRGTQRLMIAPELKYKDTYDDTTVGSLAVGSAASAIQLQGAISQAATVSGRIGNKIALHSLSLKGILNFAGVDNFTANQNADAHVRLAVVVDKEAKGDELSAADVFDQATGTTFSSFDQRNTNQKLKL